MRLSKSFFSFEVNYYRLLILGILAHIVILFFQAGDIVDDAYISARYARNLVSGYGLVYNRSKEQGKVEGYSNFLWVLLIALGLKLGIEPKLVTQTLGGISSLASVLLCFLIVRRRSGSSSLGLLASFCLMTDLNLVIWAMGGLETTFFAFLLLLSFYFYLNKRVILAYIASFFCALCRLDGILVFISMVLYEVLRDFLLADSQKVSWGKYLMRWLWFILPYSCYFLWRVFYYDSFLSNIFYAKTGLGFVALREAGIYFGGFLLEEGLFFCILVIWGIYSALRQRFSVSGAFWIFIVLYLALISIVGGDWMPHYRLMVHLVPILYPLFITCIFSPDKFERIKSYKLIYILCALITIFNFFRIIRYEWKDSYEKNWHRNQKEFYLATANWVLQNVWQSESIACGDIGYIGYISDVDRIIDTMGLVDRHLGRLAGISSMATDLDYVFSQKPVLILSLVNKYRDGTELGHSEFDRRLFSDPRLKESYVLKKEVFGWVQEELSRTDWKKRRSSVFFRYYFLKSDILKNLYKSSS